MRTYFTVTIWYKYRGQVCLVWGRGERKTNIAYPTLKDLQNANGSLDNDAEVWEEMDNLIYLGDSFFTS